ncbi:WD40-repeat-containing domain protein [Dendryphion nanum]|uniref:Mitochondrial division protein 1 n=1 Tax=Dendryphion nanum TaxID=256645 RepID=A0A9P9I748_9PLEO|nr:WD40-repeat-containing domain protein [Dendryphion nanum]
MKEIREREAGQRFVLNAHTLAINAVAFSPDAKMIATGSMDETIKIWDVETRALLHELKHHSGPVNSVCFSPDGTTIASGSADSTGRLFNLDSGEEFSFSHEGSVNSVVFSPDGRLFLSGSSDRTVRVWAAENASFQQEFKGHVKSVKTVTFGLDTDTCFSGGDDWAVRMWNLDSGELARDPIRCDNVAINSVAFSADGKKVVSGSVGRAVKVWYAGPESLSLLKELAGHEKAVTFVAFSLDGETIASASLDGTIRLWDL